jgi:hypothetical protein
MSKAVRAEEGRRFLLIRRIDGCSSKAVMTEEEEEEEEEDEDAEEVFAQSSN